MRSALQLALVLSIWVGCGSDSGIQSTGASATGIGGADTEARSGGNEERVAECDGAALGTPCGRPGDRHHCVFDACIRNACGDGWPADGETCDDGNERDGDGCDSHCRMEVPPGCGNGVLEPGERCDDGNTTDADLCTRLCTTTVCGDGILGAGEDCDDGNTRNGDACSGACRVSIVSVPTAGTGGQAGDGEAGSGEAGTSAAGSGAAGTDAAGTGAAGTNAAGSGAAGTGAAGSGAAGTGSAGVGATPDESCGACRQMHCAAYQGIDWVAGCFDATGIGDAARSAVEVTFTPAQVQACVDAMACAFANECGYTAGAIANDCYCGAFGSGFSLDDCIAGGPKGGTDAPCSPAWRAATGETSSANVLGAVTDISTPAGWVYFLLECEVEFCNDGPDGDCTP